MTQHEATLKFLKTLEDTPQPKAAGWSEEWGTFKRAALSGASRTATAEQWAPGEYRANEVWSLDGSLLRRRAWDLYLNNPYAQSGVNSYISNVIATGLWPERSPSFERAFRRWSGVDGFATRECDISRDQTFSELESSWIREVLVGGGCLANFIYVNPRTQRVPLSIELIGEDRFADNMAWSGTNQKTANAVVGGREIDKSTGRTIAFHVYPQSDDMTYDTVTKPIRIPAANAEYGYLKRNSREKRGTTILRSCVLWLQALGYYVDNELFASNLKSMYAYVLEQNENWVDTDNIGTPDLTNDGETVQRVTRGMVYRATNGGTIKTVGPNVPQEGSVGWIKLLQNAISVAIDLSYEEVFRDYSNSTLGTLRVSGNADRKRFEPLQDFTLSHFGNPVLRRFDAEAVSAGLPGFPTPAEYVAEIDDLLELQEWLIPGWDSPNPVDDARADEINLRINADSLHKIIRRKGGSVSETLEERGWETKEVKRLEIAAPVGKSEKTQPVPSNPDTPRKSVK